MRRFKMVAVMFCLFVPAIVAAQWPPERLKNVKVMRADMPVQALIDTMISFTRALGVRCSYCHVGGETTPFETLDFSSDSMPAKVKARDLSPLHAGGGGETSRFVCGYMTCDPYLCKPILSGLPAVLKVNIRSDRSGHWLESSILHLLEEAASGRVGSEAMLAKLSEALFIDTLRRYLSGLPEQQTGWLAGTRDSIVGKSLALLHSRFAHPWTIADLADSREISAPHVAEAVGYRRFDRM